MRIGYHPLFSQPLSSIFEDGNFNLEGEQVALSYDYSAFENALISGDLDFFIFPLHLTPVNRADEVKIWALTERKYSDYTLVVSVEKASEKIILLPDSGQVFYPDQMIIEEFQKIVPGINFNGIDEVLLLESFYKREHYAYIIPRMYLKTEEMIDFKTLNLNPREFSHPGGMGAWAIVGIGNDKRGKLVRNNHDHATGLLTNLERKLELMVPGNLNVHAEQDNSNYYHLYASHLVEGNVKKVHISQATRSNLVEQLTGNLGF